MLGFRPCPVDDAPAAALVQGMRDEIAALYDGLDLDGPEMPKAGPDRSARRAARSWSASTTASLSAAAV
jgi:hypothetical protein